jgi:hypothetical protein
MYFLTYGVNFRVLRLRCFRAATTGSGQPQIFHTPTLTPFSLREYPASRPTYLLASKQ